MLTCLILAGCGDVKVGLRSEQPVTQKIKHVISHPGEPIVILENIKVKAKLHTGDEIDQDVGGWVAHPKSHWDAIRKKIKALEKKNAVLEKK